MVLNLQIFPLWWTAALVNYNALTTTLGAQCLNFGLIARAAAKGVSHDIDRKCRRSNESVMCLERRETLKTFVHKGRAFKGQEAIACKWHSLHAVWVSPWSKSSCSAGGVPKWFRFACRFMTVQHNAPRTDPLGLYSLRLATGPDTGFRRN